MKKKIIYSGVEKVEYTFSPSEIKEALLNYYNDFVSQNFDMDKTEITLYESWDGRVEESGGCAEVTVLYQLEKKE